MRPTARLRLLFRPGLLLIGVGVAVALGGSTFLPRFLPWLVAGVFVWAGFTLWARERGWTLRKALQGWHFQEPTPRRSRELRHGEVFDRAVRLTQVPNVPLAQMMCSRLRANGIEAFYKGTTPFGGDAMGIADLNPALPAEIWVGEHHLDQARRLLDEA
jgi:hypothetical protein